MKIPFSPPDITDAEVEQVAEALRSGWITTGPKTKELEREVADFCGVNRAVCLNSQTACAEMTLRVLGVGEGDDVITCAYTYTASASVVCHVGAKLVLIDTQKDSLEMDYEKLADAITEKTKVIIPIDLGGVPCDYDRIFSIVESKKHLFHPSNDIQKAIGRIIVMTDAAHAFGAEWHGKKVPEVLMSGHHANIEKWRREQSIYRTAKRRPDLLKKADLTNKEWNYVRQLRKQWKEEEEQIK